ncbi:transcriptional regulatory [Fusarium albosuccineum]|uniref:Transcriptional regulatory n=1 Tax=Fusarium albosuccineum TaxID=1237068 RepID=A0A8H4LKY0_9HYPO|nr:transcriptional regulatory [Fusarium albosuccineum]
MRPIAPHQQPSNPVSLHELRIIPPRVKRASRRWERTGKPKSRAGCLTCKTRRVKCDEAKPTCVRCAKANFECDGYDSEPGSKSPSSNDANSHGTSRLVAGQPVLLPKADASPTTPPLDTSPASSAYSDTHASLHLMGSLASTSNSVTYFDAFRNQLSQSNDGFYYSGFFARIIMEESLLDECIRQSVLAIGALTHAAMLAAQEPYQSNNIRTMTSTPPRFADEHHQESLRYYAHALTRFRDRMQTDHQVSHRWILIMTLLLVVYEILQSDFETADRLLDCGVRVLQDSLKSYQNMPTSQLQAFASGGTPSHAQTLPCFAMADEYCSRLSLKWASVILIKNDSLLQFLDLGVDSSTSFATSWSEFNVFADKYLSQYCTMSIGGSEILTGSHASG